MLTIHSTFTALSIKRDRAHSINIQTGNAAKTKKAAAKKNDKKMTTNRVVNMIRDASINAARLGEIWYNQFMPAEYKKEKRRFYRHPMSVPITLTAAKEKKEGRSKSLDISLGGLSFLWPRRLRKGALLDVKVAVKKKLFGIRSKVAYAKEDPKTGKFRTGVCFMDTPSAFMARLAEEMLEIMRYRKNLSRQFGREIPEEEAASRWIKKYAAGFPR